MVRKIVALRHGERVDFSYGKNWFETCFDKQGNYTQTPALNLPATLLKRQGMPKSYKHDCPLTLTGLQQGQLVGQELISGHALGQLDIYVSPSLRSIQTANSLLQGINMAGQGHVNVTLKVEPSLFEWAGFCQYQGMPHWVTVPELIEGGYPVDPLYEPFLNIGALSVNESVEQYYRRSHAFVMNVLSRTENDLILVGHSATPNAVTRQLCGQGPCSNFQEMVEVLHGVPYAGFSIAEQAEAGGIWKVTKRADW